MSPWQRPQEPVSTHCPCRAELRWPTRRPRSTASLGGNEDALAAVPVRFTRLGAWAAGHFRRVLIGWVLVVLVFGIFAVHVDNALAGAGWQASNSQSVAARAIIEKDFSGLGATALQVVIVDHHGPIASDPTCRPPW